jgi:hypothetical protein
MIRLLIALLNLLVLLFLQIFPGNVSVKMDVPAQVNAGSEFEVRITLNKGDLEGFSRLQQNIPAGLSAVSDESSNADFSFSDKRVRLIWLKTPKAGEITVSYRVKVDEKLKGNFTLGGQFSYIENNERKSIDISDVSIAILPSTKLDPSMIVDVNEYEKKYGPAILPAASEASRIAVIRQTPVAGKDGDYIVNLLVNKEGKRNFAKIEETIPDGYTAVALDTKDAIFTFKSRKVKFLWMTLPSDAHFMVSYRLIPKNKAKLSAPVMQGAFSYLVEDHTESLPIAEKDLQLANLNDNEISDLIAQVKSEPVATQTIAVAAAVTTEQPSKAEKRRQIRREKAEASELEAENGVYYRIQLAASHKKVNIRRYFRNLKLDKPVRMEKQDGWHKYSVGSFPEYKGARDYRMQIWSSTPVKDAFVTAYNNGKRITVQEALMVTDQHWIK